MNYARYFTTSAITLLISFSQLQQIASRLVGESGNNDKTQIALLSCTIKNRLDNGWSVAGVLKHYYAPDKKANIESIGILRNTLNGDSMISRCRELYFAYSDNDVVNLGINTNILPIVKYNGINYYSRSQYAYLWK